MMPIITGHIAPGGTKVYFTPPPPTTGPSATPGKFGQIPRSEIPERDKIHFRCKEELGFWDSLMEKVRSAFGLRKAWVEISVYDQSCDHTMNTYLNINSFREELSTKGQGQVDQHAIDELSYAVFAPNVASKKAMQIFNSVFPDQPRT